MSTKINVSQINSSNLVALHGLTHTAGQAIVGDGSTFTLQDVVLNSEVGAASGVAPLNSSSKIDATYLPSYVDDVEEYANLAAFPATGEAGKIYITLDTDKIYRWSGSVYVEISGLTGALLAANNLSDVASRQAALNNLLNATGSTEGDIAYFNGTNWVNLARGTTGQVLQATASTINWATLAAAPTKVFAEAPSGSINGTNTAFTLAHTPVAGTVRLYLNGIRQLAGGVDYTISGATITYVTAPETGSSLIADYEY